MEKMKRNNGILGERILLFSFCVSIIPVFQLLLPPVSAERRRTCLGEAERRRTCLGEAERRQTCHVKMSFPFI